MTHEEKRAAFIAAITSPKFAYTRARSWRLSGHVEDQSDYNVTVYHREPASPTGVQAAGGWSGLDEACEMLAAHGRTSPLSPTEGLNKSGARVF